MSDYKANPWLNNYEKTYEEMREKQNYLMNKYSTNKTYIKPETVQPPTVVPKTYPTAYTLINEKKNEPLSEEQQTLFNQAIELYHKGLDGDEESVKNSHEVLKKLYFQAPNNVLVEAYYGCLISLLGRDEFNPLERFKLAMKGLKLLDKAVSKESDNLEIRNLRGYVSAKLPEMYFHRNSTAVDDFTYLVSRYEKDNTSLSKEHYLQLLLDLGRAYKELGKTNEAQKVWDRLISIVPSQKFIDLVKQSGGQVKEDALLKSNEGSSAESTSSSAGGDDSGKKKAPMKV